MTSPYDDNPTPPPNARPLVVDLDGTLVATDTLVELSLQATGRQPRALPQLAAALSRGRVRYKQVLAQAAELDVQTLPYRDAVLELIRTARASGRPVVLATASHACTADAVAAHLGLFDAVLATRDEANIKGRNKLDAVRGLLTERGWGAVFDYVGDSDADLAVWAGCHTAYLVDVKPATADQVVAQQRVIELVPRRPALWAELLRAGRPVQWSKNLLLAVPFLAAQEGGQLVHWFEFVVAFLAFGLCASAVYLVNDLLDLRSDRLHPTKRQRPLAMGTLPVQAGVAAAPALVLGALLLSLVFLPGGFAVALLVYTAAAWLYSLAVKNKVMLDVVWLAGLYTLRVIAGGLATDTPASPWLLALALFLFLSIALVKRYAELRLLASEGHTAAAGRNYRVDDQQLLSVMGVSSGMIGVLVLALYIQSANVYTLYEHPAALWAVCPLMLYWIGRLWVRAHRREICDDPLMFALTDRTSYIIALLTVLAAMVAAG